MKKLKFFEKNDFMEGMDNKTFQTMKPTDEIIKRRERDFKYNTKVRKKAYRIRLQLELQQEVITTKMDTLDAMGCPSLEELDIEFTLEPKELSSLISKYGAWK